MEGEDGGPAGGSCAVQGHVQNAMRGLDAVLLNATQAEGDANVWESFNNYNGCLFSILFYIYYGVTCLFLSFIVLILSFLSLLSCVFKVLYV